MNLDSGQTGWVLVESDFGDLGRHYHSTLLVTRRSSPGITEKIPLPIQPNGRISEVIRLPDDIDRLGWRPPADGRFDAARLSIRRVGWAERICRMAFRVFIVSRWVPKHELRQAGLTLRGALADLPEAYRLAGRFEAPCPISDYADWPGGFNGLLMEDVARIEAHIGCFTDRPHFQLVIVVDGMGPDALRETLAALRAQLYQSFTCTVVDTTGMTPALQNVDTELLNTGTGSRFVEQSAISAWLAGFNASLAGDRARDWVMLVRAGDILPRHSLYWFACEAIEHPGTPVIYSDDDAVASRGNHSHPRFKPDWSPAQLRSTNYIGAAAILRGGAVAAAAGVTPDCCQHGNYDLLLRVSGRADAKPVHVPAVLYHRRATTGTRFKVQGSGFKVQGSRFTEEAGSRDKGQGTSYSQVGAWEDDEWCRAKLQEHLAGTGVSASVEATLPGCWRVRYRLPDTPPLVSIIVPTRDALPLLRQCVESVLAKTTYPRFEILIVDNQSTDPAALAYFGTIAAHPVVRVLRYDRPFNYSAINNFAAREARGEALCLLNNDTEVISPDWLDEMAGELLHEDVGAVGARLLYPDGSVQHAGVSVGPGGAADHLHSHVARDDPGYCNRAVITHELSAVTAACLLTWKSLYERLGGLNEQDLPVAFNDVDYCLRLQEAGYRVVYAAHAELFHHESATRGREDTLRKKLRAHRELDYLRARWAARLRNDPYYNPNLSYLRTNFFLSEYPRVKRPWST